MKYQYPGSVARINGNSMYEKLYINVYILYMLNIVQYACICTWPRVITLWILYIIKSLFV